MIALVKLAMLGINAKDPLFVVNPGRAWKGEYDLSATLQKKTKATEPRLKQLTAMPYLFPESQKELNAILKTMGDISATDCTIDAWRMRYITAIFERLEYVVDKPEHLIGYFKSTVLRPTSSSNTRPTWATMVLIAILSIESGVMGKSLFLKWVAPFLRPDSTVADWLKLRQQFEAELTEANNTSQQETASPLIPYLRKSKVRAATITTTIPQRAVDFCTIDFTQAVEMIRTATFDFILIKAGANWWVSEMRTGEDQLLTQAMDALIPVNANWPSTIAKQHTTVINGRVISAHQTNRNLLIELTGDGYVNWASTVAETPTTAE